MIHTLRTPLVCAICIGTCLLSAAPALCAANEPALANNPAITSAAPESAYQASDFFGMRGGFVHPSLTVSSLSSDNITNSPNNKLSDISMIYSPSIWLALPRSQQTRLDVVSSNTAPGGRQMFVEKNRSFTRYQGYAFYGADIEEFSSHSERNTVKQAAMGYFQYNLPGGLSFDVFNKYTDSADPIGTGDSTVIDAFKNNLTGLMVDYDLGAKFNLRADYNHFRLSYDLLDSRAKSRNDNSYSGYIFYKYSPKTSLFTQYEFVNVNYDTNITENNDQHHYSLGAKWSPTEKTSVRAKLGVVDRNSKNNPAGDGLDPIMELVGNHQLTAKTSLQLLASQKANESTVASASYSNDTTLSAAALVQFTEKIGASLTLSYIRSAFNEHAGELGRTDNLFALAPLVRYMFKEWLMADLGYEYSKRESNQDDFDFATNKLFIRLSSGF